MEPISRREFVKRAAVAGAMFTSFPTILAACNSTNTSSNKPSKLTIAAVQGAEDGPLKKVAPMYQSQTGITMEVVEFPYDQLFEKLVTTFQANGSSYDLCMMDDPWMPKFGTMGALHPRLRHPEHRLRRGDVAATEGAGAAIRARQDPAPLRHHDRGQRRDVHVSQGSRHERARQLE